MHWGLRRAGIKIHVEAHSAVGQKFRLAQCQVMLGRADRSAVERCQYRASIVVVGANVEDHDEREQSERQLPEAAIRLRQWEAARHPAEPLSSGQGGLAMKQDVVERI